MQKSRCLFSFITEAIFFLWPGDDMRANFVLVFLASHGNSHRGDMHCL